MGQPAGSSEHESLCAAKRGSVSSGGELASAHAAGSSRSVVQPEAFPTRPSLLSPQHPTSPPTAAALSCRSPQSPPALPAGLGARFLPLSEAVKAPILQSQLCQRPAAPQPPCTAPRQRTRCLHSAQGLGEGLCCLGPHPQVWDSGAGSLRWWLWLGPQ